MAQRAPADVESDDAQTKLWRALEFFPTPPWAARAGAEIVKFLDPRAKTIWEPACGEGHMAAAIGENAKWTVFATDIHQFDAGYETNDFLGPDCYRPHRVDWIITNPPFRTAAEFVRKGLTIAGRGVAVLCRLAFLESAERFDLLFRSEHPLSHCAYFSERVPMTLGRWSPKASSATAYAWFFFDKEWPRLRSPELIAIPPGTRARLSRPEDVHRFAKRSETPLFNNSRVEPSPASAEREKAAPAWDSSAGAAALADTAPVVGHT